jgi:3-oxoacyl-[acyl-carrier-protein] synthase-3
MIIVSTTSTDKIMPGISYLVQKELDIKNCMCLDILAGCNGYINAFDIARNYIAIGKINCALIIGVEILSSVVDKNDPSTSIILSDGAGATLIKKSNKKNKYYSIIKSIGEQSDILKYNSNKKIQMDGSKVYKYAITDTVSKITELLEISNENLDNIKYIVPHQSNLKIIKGMANRLNVSIDKFFINIKNVGNTFCASIPIALEEMQEKNLLLKGDKVILLGYGGGLNTGCILLEI